ncbi:hypothetical protein NPIL_692051 [Nephila pilipes]|uniref:Uncharacterized protein n=1 Tax=Nephila pilipes TaxID=299642 RepID=A0A8X6TSC9_NEPPI|nr:hypothetical protein NPIL_692051 [Nephila pilipes]
MLEGSHKGGRRGQETGLYEARGLTDNTLSSRVGIVIGGEKQNGTGNICQNRQVFDHRNISFQKPPPSDTGESSFKFITPTEPIPRKQGTYLGALIWWNFANNVPVAPQEQGRNNRESQEEREKRRSIPSSIAHQ